MPSASFAGKGSDSTYSKKETGEIQPIEAAVIHYATFVLTIAVLVAIRIVADRFDRQRIREHVQRSGGKVLDIAWNPLGPGWYGSSERIYDVSYKTRNGRTLTAVCKTSMFSGVYWTSDAAPSGFAEILETPAEAIECMECGSKIPARQTHCPKCGWSYRQMKKPIPNSPRVSACIYGKVIPSF